MATTKERLEILEREVARLKNILNEILPPQNEIVRQLVEAISNNDKKKLRELNKLAELRMNRGEIEAQGGRKKVSKEST